ncbi:hypothetical protein PHYPO_G00159570 [Pangasianodon hypophthalmus]|uniref:Uncharacterized protein n=1 Tax=Pangasianodon hypophthalmus TaxID=310915 RepID=A0A5N5JSX1_PANHP|nr:hypothetical protein PHYPO_G00159570 [Pangasianodon hypophthalmus]
MQILLIPGCEIDIEKYIDRMAVDCRRGRSNFQPINDRGRSHVTRRRLKTQIKPRDIICCLRTEERELVEARERDPKALRLERCIIEPGMPPLEMT